MHMYNVEVEIFRDMLPRSLPREPSTFIIFPDNGITNVVFVYSSNTTIFTGRIQSIFYVMYNYMFRHLMMVIFSLYMKYLLSSHTNCTWAVYMGYGECKVDTRSRICHKVWTVWVT